MKTIRLLLADDHTLVRAGIRSLLQTIPGIEVVAEAGDGRQALAVIENQRPDVVLMDIAMPGLNGLEAVAQVAESFPYVRVIILSMHSNEEYVLRALRAGAAGYLLKDTGPAELELAITAVMKNETYLTPTVSKHVTDYVRRTADEIPPSSLERLTPRQREILQLIAEGHTTQEIAHLLELSVKTVDTHRSQLMDRLDIHDIAGLVRYAIRVGLITAEE
jgi:DNA-binding NarL/FixJ family response regulator